MPLMQQTDSLAYGRATAIDGMVVIATGLAEVRAFAATHLGQTPPGGVTLSFVANPGGEVVVYGWKSDGSAAGPAAFTWIAIGSPVV